MSDFDLNTFLQTYRPKSLKQYLAPYMHHRKLVNYALLENDKSALICSKTYVKYINIEDASDGKFRSSHIKAGGILIGCGKFVGKKFIETDNPLEWSSCVLKRTSSESSMRSVLKLKFDPSVVRNEKGEIIKERSDAKIFYIKLSKYYIFYRQFDNGIRDIMKNRIGEIELLDSKGNKIN
jgi:hypothetical protein